MRYIRMSDLSQVNIEPPHRAYSIRSLDYRERIDVTKRLVAGLRQEADDRDDWRVRNKCDVITAKLGELEVACDMTIEQELSA